MRPEGSRNDRCALRTRQDILRSEPALILHRDPPMHDGKLSGLPRLAPYGQIWHVWPGQNISFLQEGNLHSFRRYPARLRMFGHGECGQSAHRLAGQHGNRLQPRRAVRQA